ncbi:uncharacterized protein [Chamaea fasciata]|uniref:uncharacterized protein n=1 Tax=Chamaea fasciata TaxID=190680 RepID=UPI00336A7FD1
MGSGRGARRLLLILSCVPAGTDGEPSDKPVHPSKPCSSLLWKGRGDESAGAGLGWYPGGNGGGTARDTEPRGSRGCSRAGAEAVPSPGKQESAGKGVHLDGPSGTMKEDPSEEQMVSRSHHTARAGLTPWLPHPTPCLLASHRVDPLQGQLEGTWGAASWVNPSPGEIGSCRKQDGAAAGGEGGGSVGFPGERSLLRAPSQRDGDRPSPTLPKPLGQWFFSTPVETGSWGVITLGRSTTNPNILGSSPEGGSWSRDGWELSPRCLGGSIVGTGMGMEQTLEQPGQLHQTSRGVPSAPSCVQDVLHPWPGRGRRG